MNGPIKLRIMSMSSFFIKRANQFVANLQIKRGFLKRAHIEVGFYFDFNVLVIVCGECSIRKRQMDFSDGMIPDS